MAETSTHVGLGAKIMGVDEIFPVFWSGRNPIGEIPKILAREAKILRVDITNAGVGSSRVPVSEIPEILAKGARML